MQDAAKVVIFFQSWGSYADVSAILHLPDGFKYYTTLCLVAGQMSNDVIKGAAKRKQLFPSNLPG
jgi:hypothetical protein